MRWTDSSVRWTRFSPRGWAALGVAGAVALLSGCVVAPVDDGYADYGYSSTTVYTTYGSPPPPRVEYRTVAPAPNYIWIGGDWFWTGNRYDWRPGRWAPPGYHYVPPPPPRPHFRPPPPPVRPAPWPSRPEVRPDDRPRPPFWRPDDGPRPPQVRPDRPDRPDRGEGRPPQWRPDGDGRPQVRPDRPRPPEGRPERPSREEERAWPSHRRDREEGGRD